MFWNSKPAADPAVELTQRKEARKADEIAATFTRLAQPVSIGDLAAQFGREAERNSHISFAPELDCIDPEETGWHWRRSTRSTDHYRIYRQDILSSAAFGAFTSALAEKGISCELTEVDDPWTGGTSGVRCGAKVRMHLFSEAHNPPPRPPYASVRAP